MTSKSTLRKTEGSKLKMHGLSTKKAKKDHLSTPNENFYSTPEEGKTPLTSNCQEKKVKIRNRFTELVAILICLHLKSR